MNLNFGFRGDYGVAGTGLITVYSIVQLIGATTAVTSSLRTTVISAVMVPPAGITFDVPNPNTIIVKGIDKELVGQTAANIRTKRPPEVYRGKGIKYAEEVIRRKEGKAGKK